MASPITAGSCQTGGLNHIDESSFLREGIWHYAGTVPIRVRVLFGPNALSTDDFEAFDADGQPKLCYFIAYERAGEPGRFPNFITNFKSQDEAIAFVEEQFPGVVWCPSGSLAP